MHAFVCKLLSFHLTVFHNLFDDDVSHIETCIVLKMSVLFMKVATYFQLS